MGVPAGTLRQVYDSLDFDALEAAGIANPRERAGVLTYLDELGFTVEEMVQAERRGRLFGLATPFRSGLWPPVHRAISLCWLRAEPGQWPLIYRPVHDCRHHAKEYACPPHAVVVAVHIV